MGAATAVLVFLSTTAMAPFSVSSAFADAGRVMPLEQRYQQNLDSAMSTESLIDTSVTAIAEEAKGAGGAGGEAAAGAEALYTLQQFMFSGVVSWGGYKFTYYSQQVLPGAGLQVPGRHVNADGYVSDGEGYVVLAGSAPKGTVYDTPFGYQGKIYDRGTVGNHLDVYIR